MRSYRCRIRDQGWRSTTHGSSQREHRRSQGSRHACAKAGKQPTRHAGPYGASFDGTEQDGTTPVRGLTFERRWTRPGVHPYDEITWEYRTAGIANESGKSVFEQKDVEVPDFWSQLATNVVVSKYFRGHLGTPERETSVRQLIDRVVNTITAWAETQHYFATDDDLQTFKAELTHLIVHQKMAFNSPVWFNVGIEQKPQCSACFINSVEDTMSSIMDLAKTEAMLFKFGSGAGSNLSTIRSSKEKMAGGGTASGPVSFMKGYDAFAGVVKSGGKTRRAAKMVILDAGHPDVLEFIDSKAHEEQKAWALIEAGYDPSFTGEAYGSVFFQNANHSVRVTDAFMQAVVDDKEWKTHAVVAPHHVDGHLQGPRHLPQDGRRRPPLRRPGHPVRHDHQRVAHLGQHGPDPRVQPVLRVHVPQRHRLQPGLAQPDEVRRRGRRVRRRGLPVRGQGDHHRAGDPRRQRVVPDAAGSRRTPTSSGRSASATPTSARC